MTDVNPMQIRLFVAEALAREAGALARKRFSESSFKVGLKGPQDYLTEVDGETEELIAKGLSAAFPDDGFIGEESAARGVQDDRPTWVVDPIDGTVNFAKGVPFFCISIACVAAGEMEIGVIYDPMQDELFSARRGGGARLNGAPIRTSATTALANATIEVGWNARGGAPKYLDLIRHVALWGAARVPHRLRRAGAGLCGGRTAGRLRRAPHARLGRARGPPLDPRGGRLRQRLPGRWRADEGQCGARLRGWPQDGPPLRSAYRGRQRMTLVALASGQARASVAPLGAEARAWSVGGRDLLWPGDPAIWPEISPILYPVVGWTRNGQERVGGRTYDLALHGFARFETFAVEAQGADFVRFALADNDRTRAIYPFAFRFAVEYRLTGEALGVAIEVGNPGEAPAPYACGLHPGFRWPLGDGGRRAPAFASRRRSARTSRSWRRAA